MNHIPCVQGSEEWHYHRHGLPTASGAERFITAKRWEPAAGRRAYQLELLTELALDMSLDQVTTEAMQSGHDWEPKARAAYELDQGVDVAPCGFCTTDDGRMGASPDGFVGEEGLVELKCPFKPDRHMGYLVQPESLKSEYFVQTQAQLYVTGRKWTDLISYFQSLPMVLLRIMPDPGFQEKFDAALKTFLREFADLIEAAKARGVEFPESRQAPLANPVVSLIAQPTLITESDLDEILRLRKQADEALARLRKG